MEGETLIIILEASGVPLGHRSWRGIEEMARPLRRLCNLLLMGLTSGNPSTVMLGMEVINIHSPAGTFKVRLELRPPLPAPLQPESQADPTGGRNSK